MKRDAIIQGINEQIKKLNELKKEYSYNESINLLHNDLKAVCKCIKKGGNISDVQNIGIHNFTAYLNFNIPLGVSLKQYIENISNNIEDAIGIKKHTVAVNYLYSEFVTI